VIPPDPPCSSFLFQDFRKLNVLMLPSVIRRPCLGGPLPATRGGAAGSRPRPNRCCLALASCGRLIPRARAMSSCRSSRRRRMSRISRITGVGTRPPLKSAAAAMASSSGVRSSSRPRNVSWTEGRSGPPPVHSVGPPNFHRGPSRDRREASAFASGPWPRQAPDLYSRPLDQPGQREAERAERRREEGGGERMWDQSR
jgi:hypothetical protein